MAIFDAEEAERLCRLIRDDDHDSLRRSVNSSSVNRQNRWGFTPLMVSADCSNAPMSLYLLAAGADVGARDFCHSATALHWAAARRGSLDVARLLLAAGASIDETDGDNWTPLMWAAFKDNVEVLKLLLARGADTQLRDMSGMTAGDVAEQRRHVDSCAAFNEWTAIMTWDRHRILDEEKQMQTEAKQALIEAKRRLQGGRRERRGEES